jgi:hypothetical protein
MKIVFLIFLLLIFFRNQNLSAQDTTKTIDNKNVNPMPTDIQKVQEKYTDSLMSIPGVEGIGIGKKGSRDCIVVFVRKISKEIKHKIPKELEGYPVKIESTGEFRAFPKK